MSSVAEQRQPTASTAPTATTKPNRLPAPTLFVGPPSRNSSQLSLSKQVAESAAGRSLREPVSRQKSSLLRPNDAVSSIPELKTVQPAPAVQLRKPSERSLETKWREMQNTLDEVELTAQSATHVFSEKHAAALDELRRTQVELAKAWSRSSDGAATPTATTDKSTIAQQIESLDFATSQRKRGDTAASASTQLSGESEASETTIKSDKSHLGSDAAEDIRVANERRAANEAYFKKVDQNVRDVVTKLEAVAAAMRDVEDESRSLWSGASTSSRSHEAD